MTVLDHSVPTLYCSWVVCGALESTARPFYSAYLDFHDPTNMILPLLSDLEIAPALDQGRKSARHLTEAGWNIWDPLTCYFVVLYHVPFLFVRGSFMGPRGLVTVRCIHMLLVIRYSGIHVLRLAL